MENDGFESYFEELKQKGISLTEAQKKWYMKKATVLGSNMKKEYPSTADEAFEMNVDGFYYATHLSIARAQKRILNIPFNPVLKVHSAWDLGYHDSSSIILFQLSGREIHIIDFIESTGKSLADYIKQLKEKPYIYGTHIAPHDIKIHEYSTGISRFDTAASLGIHFILAPSLLLADGIDTVRNMFNRLYFHNSDAVLKLVKHLENYSQRWDKTTGMWSGRPDHDEHSHSADSLRYLCTSIDFCLDETQTITQSEADNLWKTHGRRL